MPMGIGLGIGVTRGGGVGWWQSGSALDLYFAESLGFNSIDRTKTTPDSILTYTNPSAKMVYGSDGVLRYAPHNLLTYSEQFDNAAWTKNAATMSANSIAAPDSTTTTYTLTANAGTGTIPRFADVNVITANGAVHTASIYAKAGTYSFVQFYLNNQGAEWVNFTLSGSGTASANGSCTATITALSGGWYRLTMTYTAGSTDRRPFFMLALSGTATRAQSWNPAGTESVYFWGAQLNLGSSALTYIPTTTAAVYSLPIDHDPITFDPLGVLIEEQRTNLLTYSEQFDNADWVKSNITIAGASINAIVAPDGTTTADKIEATASAATTLRQQRAVTATTATFSIYVKIGSAATDANKFALYNVTTAADLLVINFNYSTGLITYTVGSAGASAVELDDGWWRITLSASSGITSGDTIRVYPCFVGGSETAGEFAYLWGAQLEAGAFPTSYIPTTNNPLGVTRLADQVSILTSAFGWLQTRGTVVFEAMTPVGMGNAAYLLGLVDYVSSTNYFGVLRSSGGWIWRTGTGTATIRNFDVNTGYAEGAFSKYAASYEDDVGQGMSMNGASVVEELSDPVTRAVTTFTLGRTSSIGAMHYKRLTYFPTRRSNAELQVLST